MNPAKLKDRVTIRSVTQTVDIEGTVIDTYQDAFTRFAEVRPVRGREAYINDQFLSQYEFVVTMRFDGQTKLITDKHEIIYKGQRLRIEAPPINVENMDSELRFFCRVYADGR
jgi:SPP1 family predicted phage head-tail adaptor